MLRPLHLLPMVQPTGTNTSVSAHKQLSLDVEYCSSIHGKTDYTVYKRYTPLSTLQSSELMTVAGWDTIQVTYWGFIVETTVANTEVAFGKTGCLDRQSTHNEAMRIKGGSDLHLILRSLCAGGSQRQRAVVWAEVPWYAVALLRLLGC